MTFVAWSVALLIIGVLLVVLWCLLKVGTYQWDVDGEDDERVPETADHA